VGTPLNVLIIEDSEVDALLLVLELQHGGYDPLHERVETADAVRAALQRKSWDLILCDYNLPEFDGLQALAIVKETGIECPFIIVSGVIGEEAAVEAMKAGAHDYVMKDRRQRLLSTVARELREAAIRCENKRVKAALQESEGKFRLLIENAPDAVFVQAGGCFSYLNPAAVSLFGVESAEQLLGHPLLDTIHPDYHALVRARLRLLNEEKRPVGTLEQKYLKADGSLIDVEVSAVPITYENREGSLAFVRDITSRKQAEDEQRRNREIAEQMQREIERRSEQLAALNETGLELAAELNLGTLLHSIAQRALNLIGGIACNCYLYRPDEDVMERVAEAGKELFPTRTIRTRGEGFIGHIWATGAPLLVDDYHSWPGRKREYDSFPSRALVGAPIRWGKEFLGILDVMTYTPQTYTQTDMVTLSMFTTQAAIAIRNARLYTRIEQIAITDELTGLFNRRGFFQFGEREFERALRFNRPLSALMVDIDRFKRVNDRYGHIAGDQVLRSLAACFRQNTRGIDVAGRYGGEEFVLLLPETPLSEAMHMAERLRQSIAELSIAIVPANGYPNTGTLRITVSIGVAVMTTDVTRLTDLIDWTDKALYRAKDEGRNRVVAWREEKSRPAIEQGSLL
jgi:diguanylate cyclase (GGDEF)-like protein/PAS domain S-box-containing protein